MTRIEGALSDSRRVTRTIEASFVWKSSTNRNDEDGSSMTRTMLAYAAWKSKTEAMTRTIHGMQFGRVITRRIEAH